MAHVVDILDEGIVFLPEGHPEAGLKSILKYSVRLNIVLIFFGFYTCSVTHTFSYSHILTSLILSLTLSLEKAWIHYNVVTASSRLHRRSLHWFTGAVKNFQENTFSCGLKRANMLALELARSILMGSKSFSSAGVTMVAL